MCCRDCTITSALWDKAWRCDLSRALELGEWESLVIAPLLCPLMMLISGMKRAQMDFVVAFLGITYARAVAAPLNAAYTKVSRVCSRHCFHLHGWHFGS